MKSIRYIFRRYKLAFSLNLLGLVLALAGCYVLLTQIHFIDSYNQDIKGHENIYRLYCNGIFNNDWSTTFSRPYLEKFKACPQVESVGFLRDYDDLQLDKDGSIINIEAYLCNDDLLSTVNAELLCGSFFSPNANNGVLIPASLSEKYFGTTLSVGKALKLSSGKTLNVEGVYRDFPSNSVIANAVYLNMGDENINELSNWNYKAFVRLTPGTQVNSFEKALKKQMKELLSEQYQDLPPEYAQYADEIQKKVNETLKRISITAMPLSQTYLQGHDPETDKGNLTTLYILRMAVLLLILMALINFTNFSTALSPIRMRSINTRKVMGESTRSLRMTLVGEGIAMGLTAFALAMCMVYCLGLWKFAGQYTLGSIKLQANLPLVLYTALLSVAIGILGTLYSAYYVTSFQPAWVFKGNFGLSVHGRMLRQILIGVQFVLSFTLVLFVGITYCQSRFINQSDYGYAKDNLLFGDVGYMPKEQKEALRSELEKIVGVESVGYSGFKLGLYDKCMVWERGKDDKTYYMNVIPVDWKMLRTCGIRIVEGRDFKECDGDVYIINENMKKRYPEIEMDKPLLENDLTVVGVCQNFRAFSTRIDNNHTPVTFVIFGKQYADWGDPTQFIYIRISSHSDKQDIRKKVNNVLQSFAKDATPPELKFMSECMEETYHDEIRFIRQIEASTLLLLAIAIIGVFCLTMFETEYRRKEIAIRKVMGSSIAEILLLFIKRYTLPLVVSFLVAAPLGYYLCEQWLQNFAERTVIHWWIFPFTFIIVSLIVILTVIIQSWRVATMNPIDCIKTE